MVRIDRGNAWAQVHGAPAWLLECLARHLAVPVEAVTPEALIKLQTGSRFSRTFVVDGLIWGSLVWGDQIPAGLTRHAQAVCGHYGQPCVVRDVRRRPAQGYPWHSLQDVTWRPYQDRAHEAALHMGSGVIVAPPRSGKTLLQARLIDVLALPTVVFAPTVAIVGQTYRRFAQIWGADLVGRLDGEAKPDQRDVSRPIVVSTIASALRLPAEWWATRELLIWDEFHHSAAESWHTLNQRAAHIYHRYGFTGTHFRSGEDALAMHAVLGDVIADISIDELIKEGFLACPRVMWLRHTTGKLALDTPRYETLYRKGIAEWAPRNEAVANVTKALQERGEPTIVLTKRRAHADLLGKMIDDSIVVKGGEGAQTTNAIADFLKGRFSVLIGTTVIGEGVDLPRASALVYAAGGSGGVQMMQSYFRPMTAHEGKPYGRVYDLWDSHVETLRRQSAERIQFARAQLGSGRVFAVT